jgi:spermidine synthase
VPKTENSQWYVEQVADGEVHGHAITATLTQGRSSFQEYAVVVSPRFGKMLVLDGDTQSSSLDERIYHEALVHPAAAMHGAPKRALVLGGAEGATLRELLRVPSIEKAVMVDIDGDVVAACRQHLPEWSAGALDDRRAEVIVGDAKAYVESSADSFDLIIGDLTEPLEDSPSFGLHTQEFYRSIRSRLKPGGFYALQASMAGPHNFATHARMVATLRAAFACVAPYSAYVPAFDTEWGFALCGDAFDARSVEAAERADRHARALGLANYDGETHNRLFNLPAYLRRAHAAETRVYREKG